VCGNIISEEDKEAFVTKLHVFCLISNHRAEAKALREAQWKRLVAEFKRLLHFGHFDEHSDPAVAKLHRMYSKPEIDSIIDTHLPRFKDEFFAILANSNDYPTEADISELAMRFWAQQRHLFFDSTKQFLFACMRIVKMILEKTTTHYGWDTNPDVAQFFAGFARHGFDPPVQQFANMRLAGPANAPVATITPASRVYAPHGNAPPVYAQAPKRQHLRCCPQSDRLGRPDERRPPPI